MTINRKEKILIFILILFLLIGGTYTLGVMPKNNDKKTAQEELQTVEGDIAKVKKQNEAVSPARYNKLVEEINQNEAALKQLTSPKNNINEELLPGNIQGHQDSYEIMETLEEFFGSFGVNVEGLTLSSPTTTANKKIYTVSASFETKTESLYNVVNEIARIKSYNLIRLSMTPAGEKVSGSFAMTITYIMNE